MTVDVGTTSSYFSGYIHSQLAHTLNLRCTSSKGGELLRESTRIGVCCERVREIWTENYRAGHTFSPCTLFFLTPFNHQSSLHAFSDISSPPSSTSKTGIVEYRMLICELISFPQNYHIHLLICMMCWLCT